MYWFQPLWLDNLILYIMFHSLFPVPRLALYGVIATLLTIFPMFTYFPVTIL